jgi:hypothetical protein
MSRAARHDGRHRSEDRPVFHASRLVLTAAAFVALVAALVVWMHVQLDAIVETRVSSELQVTVDAAAEGAQQLLGSAQRVAQSAVDDPRAALAMLDCLRSTHCSGLATELVPYMRAGGFAGVQLVTASGQELVREAVLHPKHMRPELLAHVATLEPMRATVVLPSPEHGPHLHVVVPLRDVGGPHLGALMFELLMDDLNRVLRAARAGKSGETYAFDRQARMLSESRFADELTRLGLLARRAPDAMAVVELRDPGYDLRSQQHPITEDRSTQPLTKMAAHAVRGESGLELTPYRDYRGVTVVGAWRFLSDVGIGIATEADAREVFGSLNEIERLLRWLVGALVVMSTAFLAAIAYAAYLHRELTRKRPASRSKDHMH